MSLSLLSLSLLTLSLLHSSTSATTFPNCHLPYTCGNLTATYPFTGHHRPSHCGPPQFHLTCTRNTTTTLTINSLTYKVNSLTIQNAKQTKQTRLNLTRTDLVASTCPSTFINTTLNSSHFALLPHKNLTLFYSCNITLNYTPRTLFSCRVNTVNLTANEGAFFLVGPIPFDPVLWDIARCPVIVTVLVSEEAAKELAGKNSLGEALRMGFEVEYIDTYKESCRECVGVGGMCGFDKDLEEFVCICGDRACNVNSISRQSMERNYKIIGASIIGALLSLIGVWCFYKTVKKEISKRRKAKIFNENGGMLLQQQLSSGHGSVEKTKLFKSFELEKATNFYNVDRVLGQGGQGTVYKGVLPDGRLVAVKKSKVSGKLNIGHFINEIVILSQINHRNVVNLLGCCLETKVPLLVYELISNGTLFQHIHNPTKEFPLNWRVCLQIAVETAQALSYLHSAASRPIYHRDIKSTNILLDDNYNAKVSDFGISRLVDVGNTHLTTHVKGTFGYLDPEYFQSHQFNEKSDVYSFGVVLVELLTGQKPIISGPYQEAKGLASHFLESMDDNRLFEIIDPQLSKEDSKIEEMVEVAHLAKACLNSKGNKRPTMKKVANQLEGIRTSREQSIPRENDENIAEEVYDDSSSSTGAWGENSPSLNVDIDSLLNS